MVDRKDESLDRDTEATDVQELHGPILRERGDPREGYEPVPMWFTALCGALVFWAGWYLSEFGGGGDAAVLDPRPEMRFPGGGGEAKQIDPAALGKKLYTAQCVSCHQQNGMGVPNQYPPLDGSSWVTEHPARTKRILLHGLKGPITVLGNSYNGNMPAFGARMKDEHIAAILTHVRTAWGNSASEITPKSVAATRAATADRRGEWTAAELEAVTGDDAPPAEEK